MVINIFVICLILFNKKLLQGRKTVKSLCLNLCGFAFVFKNIYIVNKNSPDIIIFVLKIKQNIYIGSKRKCNRLPIYYDE
jgi:hypothetical protein